MLFQVKELLSRIGARQEKGQTLIEYALLVALIAIIVIVALLLLGPQVREVFQSIYDELSGVMT